MSSGEWGPLARLIGNWEGAEGVDVSFHNAEGRVGETRYRERVTMAPFGPVENGAQKLWGLDYRMEAFREGESAAFHTEVGYWLWDGAAGHVLRCFVVPRGVTVFAQASAKPDDTRFTLEATLGHATFGVLSNAYLAEKARTTKYVCKVVLDGDTFAYESCTTYHHHVGGEIAHTDRNVLRRV